MMLVSTAWALAAVSAATTSPPVDQTTFDKEAQIAASRAAMGGAVSLIGSEPIEEVTHSGPWRLVTDSMVRKHNSFSAPAGYRYKLVSFIDLDRDGKLDRAEFVYRGEAGAIRIRFGNKKVRVILPGRPAVWGQGLFAAGPNALMINYPETSIVFVFMHQGALRAKFIGE